MIAETLNDHAAKRPLVMITGASRGIGSETAVKFASEGCDLILCCHQNKEALDKTIDRCTRAGGNVILTFVNDIADPDTVEEMCDEILSKDVVPDVLIHNAGVTKKALVQELDIYDWTDIFDTNVNSLFWICRKFVPAMVRRGSGKILATSSVYGTVGASCEVAYSASKGALNGFVRALSKELAPSHIQVNAVAPGVVDTDMLLESEMDARAVMDLQDEIAVGRFAHPKEISEVFWSLAEAPEYLTGQIITVDGGWF